MTELQCVELDMLKYIISICEEMKIRYYLVCGTALGAVKYGGFIPWDDDLDIGIFREDYEMFLTEAPAKLPPHLFLQTYASDNGYTNIFAKVRNSNTTYIEKTVQKLKMNHGVYIDIFPLDGYPDDKKLQQRIERKKRFYRKMLSCNYTAERSVFGRITNISLRILGVHRRTCGILRKYDHLVSAHPTSNSKIICNHGNWQGKLEYAPKEQYGNGVMMKFEGIDVRVPEKYDEYLTQKYGDWRADPPKEKQVGHHYYSVMDLDKPYTYYTENK